MNVYQTHLSLAYISPVPAIHDEPDNVTFVQGDFPTLASTDGRFAQGSADLVLTRLLFCGMTDWKGYIETSVNMLRPGGHLEVQELAWRWYFRGEEVGGDREWRKAYCAALHAKEFDPYLVGKMERWMRDAGMETIQVKHFPWPFTKQQRDMCQQILPKVLAGQGHTEEKIKAMFKDVEGLYKDFCVTLGRKGH